MYSEAENERFLCRMNVVSGHSILAIFLMEYSTCVISVSFLQSYHLVIFLILCFVACHLCRYFDILIDRVLFLFSCLYTSKALHPPIITYITKFCKCYSIMQWQKGRFQRALEMNERYKKQSQNRQLNCHLPNTFTIFICKRIF